MGLFTHDEDEDDEYVGVKVKVEVKVKQAIVEKVDNGYVIKDILLNKTYIARHSYDVREVIEKIFESGTKETEEGI